MLSQKGHAQLRIILARQPAFTGIRISIIEHKSTEIDICKYIYIYIYIFCIYGPARETLREKVMKLRFVLPACQFQEAVKSPNQPPRFSPSPSDTNRNQSGSGLAPSARFAIKSRPGQLETSLQAASSFSKGRTILLPAGWISEFFRLHARELQPQRPYAC